MLVRRGANRRCGSAFARPIGTSARPEKRRPERPPTAGPASILPIPFLDGGEAPSWRTAALRMGDPASGNGTKTGPVATGPAQPSSRSLTMIDDPSLHDGSTSGEGSSPPSDAAMTTSSLGAGSAWSRVRRSGAAGIIPERLRAACLERGKRLRGRRGLRCRRGHPSWPRRAPCPRPSAPSWPGRRGACRARRAGSRRAGRRLRACAVPW